MRLAAVLFLGLTTAAAAQTPPQPPRMSPQEAKKVLDEKGVDPIVENVPMQIMNGDAEALEAMIVLGVNVNAKTSLPQSPLELAAMSCANPRVMPGMSVRIINELVADHADPNTPGIQGLGPLMTAAQQCGAPVVKALIAAGAKLDSRTPQGFTPLSMALITKHYDAAEALVDAGARISPEAGAKLTDGSHDAKLKDLVRRGTGGV